MKTKKLIKIADKILASDETKQVRLLALDMLLMQKRGEFGTFVMRSHPRDEQAQELLDRCSA